MDPTVLALNRPQTLVALSPSEVPAAQQHLIAFCRQKMRSLGQEYADLHANLVIAKRNRWSRGGLIRALARAKATIGYYKKIKAAVEAGFLVIPNFDVDVIAIRVREDAGRPRFAQASYDTYDVVRAAPDLLPPGDGRYVAEKTDYTDEKFKLADGTQKRVVRRGDYIDDLPLPITLLKPQVLEAAERALALRIFDRLGIVKGSKRSDPILIGQLIDPRATGGRIVNPKVISFFVAWWLDLEGI